MKDKNRNQEIKYRENCLLYYKIIKQARGKYRNLSEEDKIKKRYYGKNRYHNV